MNKKTKKRTLSMALAAALAFSPVQALAASSDLAGHWAEDVITQWENAGMISGYEDGTFKPNNSVTRAEFVIMMNNALGLTEAGEVSFSDVQPGNWFYNAVAVAVAAGYCSGYEDGTFKPSATITRAEAAVMIANAAGLTQDETGAAGFTDSIPAWAKGSIGAVVNAGFMSGYPDGTFAANQSITRAEAVSSLNRVIGGVTANDVVVTEATEIADQTIEGNLIIDAALTDGTVTVKNTTVTGNIVVRGGAADALKLDGVTLKGKLIVEKEGAEVVLTGETKVPSAEISALSTLSADNFKGSVGTVTITKDLDTAKTVKLSVPADKVVLDGTAAVDVNEDVTTVEVTKNAEGSKVYVNSGATVDTVVADAKVAVSGSGTVKLLEVNADDVSVSTSLKVNKTEVAEGVKEPSTTTGGGGGGGGGSSSSTDDDDVEQYTTFTVKTDDDWKKAKDAAATNKYGRLQIIIPADTKATIAASETIEYNGTGNLIVDCKDPKKLDITTLSITAPNAANIYLKDGGKHTGDASDAGVSVTTLNIDTPKATVDCNWAAGTIDVAAVSDATLNVKDTATNIKIEKGSVNVTGAPSATVTVDGTGPVKVAGTIGNLTVSAAADVTIAAKIGNGTGAPTITAAKSVTVVSGAEVGAIDTTSSVATDVTVDGGKVAELKIVGTATGTFTVNGGEVAKLTVEKDSATPAINGGNIGEVTTSSAVTTALTLAPATGKTSTATIGKITPAKETAAINVTGIPKVNELTLDATTKAVAATLEKTTVDTITTKTATSGVKVTTNTGATVNALIATGSGKTSVEGKATGALKGIAATDTATLEIDTAAKVANTADVVKANNATITVKDDTELPVAQKTVASIAIQEKELTANYGEALPLNQIHVTVTYSDKTTKSATAEELGSLLQVNGYNNTTLLTVQPVTLTYAGATATINVTVKMDQATWAPKAQEEVAKAATAFTEKKLELTTTNVSTPISVPTQVDAETATGEFVVVDWAATQNADYVTIAEAGLKAKTITVTQRHDTQPITVTLQATIKGDKSKNTTTDTYTIVIPAANQGAQDAWAATTAYLNAPIEIDVAKDDKGTIIDTAVQTAAQTAGQSTSYSFTVDKTSLKDNGNGSYTATVTVKHTSDAKDVFTTTVTMTLVDQAANAKAALALLKDFSAVKMEDGDLTQSDAADKVKAAIEKQATAILQANKDYASYTVTAEGTYADRVWTGKLTVNGGSSNVAADETNRTITATEHATATVTGGESMNGDVKTFTDELTVRLKGDTFKAAKDVNASTWFGTSLPKNVTATFNATEGEATGTITLAIAKDQKADVAANKALTLEIPTSALTTGKEAITPVGDLKLTLTDVQEDLSFSKTYVADTNAVLVSLTKEAQEAGIGFNTDNIKQASNWLLGGDDSAWGTLDSVTAKEGTVVLPLQPALEAGGNATLTIKAAVFTTTDRMATGSDLTVEFVKLYDNAALVDAPLNVTVGTLAAGSTAPQATTTWAGKKDVSTVWVEKGQEDPVTTFTAGKTYTAKITVNAADNVGFNSALDNTHGNVTVNGEAVTTVTVDSTAKSLTIEKDFVAQAAPLTDKNVIMANIVDHSTPPVSDVCGEKSISMQSGNLSTTDLNVVNITTENLKVHENGNNTLGHWTGFAVLAPSGAEKMKAAFATSEEELNSKMGSWSADSLEQAVDGNNQPGIAFFIDAFDYAHGGTKTYAAVQFLDEKGTPITPIYKFHANLDEVTPAKQGVIVQNTGNYVVTGAENAATSGATIEYTGEAPTVSVLKTALQATTLNTDSEGATLKVVENGAATSVTNADKFVDASEKGDGETVASTDVLLVLSADRSVVGKYTITVTSGAGA